jgi:hypothetical protein
MKDLQTTENKLKEAFDLVAELLMAEYPERESDVLMNWLMEMNLPLLWK